MSYIKIKRKFQITVAMRKKLNLLEGDILEIKEVNGEVILTPKLLTRKENNADYTPNEKTAKILLDKNNYSTGFYNLEDLFEDLEKELEQIRMSSSP